MASDPRNLPLSFTCNAGKDRTGIGALLLLTGLGVGAGVIMEDFLMTNQFNALPRRVASQMRAMARLWSPTGDLSAYSAADLAVLQDALATVSGAHELNMREALRVMRAAHGSVRGFMRAELGWTAAMEARIRAAVLEPAGPPGADSTAREAPPRGRL